MLTEKMGPQLGVANEIYALGKHWTIGRLTKSVWDNLLDWAQPRIKHPLEVLKPIIKDVSDETAFKLISEARKEYPLILTILHPIYQECINNTPEGQVQQLYELLKPAHPEMTPDLAFEIFKDTKQDNLQAAIFKAAGQCPPEEKKIGANGNAAASQPRNQLADNHFISTESVSLTSLGNTATHPG